MIQAQLSVTVGTLRNSRKIALDSIEVEVCSERMTKKPISRTKAGKAAHAQSAVEALSAEFDRRLAALNKPGAHRRLDAVVAAHGHLKRPRPKAGSSF